MYNNEEIKYDYVTANVTLAATTVLGNESLSVPEGKVVGIAAVIAGNTEDRIINLSILNNGSEVVRPADVRFSEKTNGGSFVDSVRPVSFIGGRSFEVRLNALTASATEAITVQVLFMFEKPKN